MPAASIIRYLAYTPSQGNKKVPGYYARMPFFFGDLFAKINDFVNKLLAVFSFDEHIRKRLYGVGAPQPLPLQYIVEVSYSQKVATSAMIYFCSDALQMKCAMNFGWLTSRAVDT